MRGIKFGEYKCDSEEDLAKLAAQQYYVEFGLDLNHDRLRSNISAYIPDQHFSTSDNSLDTYGS